MKNYILLFKIVNFNYILNFIKRFLKKNKILKIISILLR